MPQEILPKPLKGNSRQTLVRQGSPSRSAELRSNLLHAQAKQKETTYNIQKARRRDAFANAKGYARTKSLTNKKKIKS